MPDPLPADDDGNERPGPGEGDASAGAMRMNLGEIIGMTGEMEHLHELVSLTIDRNGGYTTDEAYFAAVHPVLDLLEVEIRVRCRTGMTRDGMKRIIRDWINRGIREARQDDRPS